MSYTISATQAKLFGFYPKYIWDEFSVAHAVTARKIKVETFGKFLEMADCETEIKEIARRALATDQIDVNLFGLEVIAKRRATLQAGRVLQNQAARELLPVAGVESECESECESEERDSGSECEYCAEKGVAMKVLQEELERCREEKAAVEEELKDCQRERNEWRAKYQMLAKESEPKRRRMLVFGSEEEC